MNSKVPYRLLMGRIPIYDPRYPFKGISPVFFQNIVELLFLVGFVWYLKWSPLLVLCYCVVEVVVSWIFSALKSKTSLGWFEYQQVSLFMISGGAVLVLSSLLVFFLWKVDAQLFSVAFFTQFIWNDNEFLLCLLVIVLQQAVEFYKHKKAILFFPADRVSVFLNPVLRLLIQLLFLVMLLLLFLVVFPLGLHWQALLMAFIWTMSKTLAGQLQVVFVPLTK